MEPLEQETITIDFNGKQIQVLIQVQVEQQCAEMDCDFESEAERIRYIQRHESGELECYGVFVTASLIGTSLDGADSISQVEVVTANARQDLLEAVIQNSMKETAVEDLKQEIKAVLKAIGRE